MILLLQLHKNLGIHGSRMVYSVCELEREELLRVDVLEQSLNEACRRYVRAKNLMDEFLGYSR